MENNGKPTVVVAPYSKPRTDKKRNAKDYPYWPQLFMAARPHFNLVQVVHGSEMPIEGAYDYAVNKTLPEIESMVKSAGFFLSVDNYMQHMAHYLGVRGIALYGPSDPALFGYPENWNLYADRKYFRPNQFQTWQQWDFNAAAFVSVDDVIEAMWVASFDRYGSDQCQESSNITDVK